jgi:hypothetical protein
MLRLSFEQAELIDQLLLKRHAAGIALALGEAWPAVSDRLKERWPAFVEAALQHGHRQGVSEPADLARFACLWCIWGATFDEKPGFEWAREILADTRRSAPLKLHQLVHRTRDELQRQRPAAPSALPVVNAAQFDAALAKVDQQMASHAAAKVVFLDQPPAVPIKACDIATIDMMVAEVEGLQEYRHHNGSWLRAAVPKLAVAPEQWTRAPEEPVALAVPSNALRAGPAARLNLKVQALAVCDPRVHPQVLHSAEQGRLVWKGRDAARLSLALYAKPVPTPDPKLGPAGIAAPSEADVQQVQIASCGLRDAGAPFGAVGIELRVVPATQWFTEVRHAGFPPMAWPAAAGGPPMPVANAVACKLEADGAPRDAGVWQRGWTTLQPQFRQGMEKLFNAWARVSDGSSARLEVEAAPLSGQAGFTWGWRRNSVSTVAMRTEGQVDLLACTIDLRLVGELAVGAARARVTLACKGRSELRMAIAQLGEPAGDGQDLTAVKRAWRFPFTLDVETLAGGDLATLYAATLPETMLGAIAGECGLRPRPDAQGLQWYFTLRLDPVTLALVSSDPVIGSSRQQRVLLPAMPLVDWSAG